MNIDFPTLLQILSYELNAAKRHGRFASLVMLNAPDTFPTLHAVLADCIRTSDIMASFDHSLAVLLGETDKEGANIAIRRWTSLFQQRIGLHAAIASFPADGDHPDHLFMTARARLERAKHDLAGAVISQE
jgi:hypothetical protein